MPVDISPSCEPAPQGSSRPQVASVVAGGEVGAGTLGDLLAVTAGRRGDAPALADHTAASRGSGEDAAPLAPEQTYAELDREVDRLASGLLECGLRPGERIGAVLANGPELLQLWFAVARAGGVMGAARSPPDPSRARPAAAPRRDLAPGRRAQAPLRA